MQRRQLLSGGVMTLLTMAAGAGAGASPRLTVWPGDAPGATSVTYDDGLDSQLDLTVPELEALGLRGTFFITLNAIAARRAEWAALVARGHELADHSVHHPCDLASRRARPFARNEIAPVERWLDDVEPGRRIRSFAYPCDVTDLGGGPPNRQERRYDTLLQRLGIDAARTSEGMPNRPATALRRPHRLQALAVGYDAPDLGSVREYLAQAARLGHWAILVVHGIGPADGTSGTIDEDLHRSILREIEASPLWCAPLGEVFARIREG